MCYLLFTVHVSHSPVDTADKKHRTALIWRYTQLCVCVCERAHVFVRSYDLVMTESKYLGPPASAAGNIMGWEWMKVTLGRVSVCVCGSVVLLQFYTLSWLMSSWYGMWAGRYVCSRAQKARPSLQLLLKLVTSIFCGQIIKKKKKTSECSNKRKSQLTKVNIQSW